MSTQLPEPKRASRRQALLAAFSKDCYFSLVLPHNLAAELAPEQIASAYRQGKWPKQDWPETATKQAQIDRDLLKRSILLSAKCASSLALLVFLMLIAIEKVHPSLPADFGKAFVGVGTWALVWGTFLQFNPARLSFRADLLHEVAHAQLVRVLFAAGTAIAAVGAFWWQ